MLIITKVKHTECLIQKKTYFPSLKLRKLSISLETPTLRSGPKNYIKKKYYTGVPLTILKRTSLRSKQKRLEAEKIRNNHTPAPNWI